MIIVNLTGGLGNQMFQYALGRHLALKNKTELKLHYTNALFNTQRQYELDIFNIKADLASSKDLKQLGVIKNRVINRFLYLIDDKYRIKFNYRVITEQLPHKFNPSILQVKDNIYLQGYWADKRYFMEIENILRKDFSLKEKLDATNRKTLDLIRKTNSISIHVRRTDAITPTNHNFLGLDYYTKSVKEIKEKITNPVFFVFSEDISWCKDNFNFSSKIHFIDYNKGKDSFKDMYLMSKCKHNITANSTFSWWGAWLNQNKNKILIRP